MQIATVRFGIVRDAIAEIIIGIAMDLAGIITMETITVAVAVVLNILYRKSLLFCS
jgi:hypothetical protein